MVRGTADPSASLGMTKERATLVWRAVSEGKAFFITLGSATAFHVTATLSFVIPSSRLAEASRERNDKACTLCNIEG
jgi:hypothetical protein